MEAGAIEHPKKKGIALISGRRLTCVLTMPNSLFIAPICQIVIRRCNTTTASAVPAGRLATPATQNWVDKKVENRND
jgi:hypothetical protein